ncbi:MAG: major capsid protein [Candidatus Symbiothrix sp.]|jgi:hypothetical protein|nr:major capsid protein [Candidatus Symbiothrix sp.]
MAMNKPLFDIDQPGMQVAVNSYKPGLGLAWQQLFPLKYTPKFDLKGIEGDEGIPVSADRVAFNTKAPQKTRQKVGSWSGKLSKIAVSRQKDEIEINEYNDLQVVAAANTEDVATARYLVDLVYNDLDFCNKAMDYKVEIDALRIGSKGIQTFPANIEGEMATEDVINFNVPTENFKGAAVVWTAANADGIKDLINAQKAITAKGLKKPMYAIMTAGKFEQLISQPAIAKRLFPRYDQTLVTADMISLASVNAYLIGKGAPQILVIDPYATIEAKDGKKTTIQPWNPKVVTLSPVPQLGYTYYKPVPNVPNNDALQAQASYYKLTRYSDLNPMLEVTMAEAYVQPALINRNSLVFINTENTAWNGGE